MTRGYIQFFHRIGNIRAGCGALCRPEVEEAVRHYLEEEQRSVLFLKWELKPSPNHPDNVHIIKEFVDILVAMGIVE